jgi:hypothetical protein
MNCLIHRAFLFYNGNVPYILMIIVEQIFRENFS